MLRIFKIVSLILLPALITGIVLWKYENYLDENLEPLTINRSIAISYGNYPKEKGLVMLNKSLERGDLQAFGSSELSSQVDQNIRLFFPRLGYEYEVNSIGRAYAQSLVDTVRLAAYETIPEKMIVVVSLQWFQSGDISIPGTESNFSELQFYRYMFSDKFSAEQKHYVAKRVGHLFKRSTVHSRECLFARVYAKSPTLFKVLKPYYWLRFKFLEIKDKHDTYKTLQGIGKENTTELKSINWKNAYAEAQKQGETACTNNNFYVYDSYYTKYLEPRIEKLKDSSKGSDLLHSKEWDDYEAFLQACNSLNIKPYVIFMSTNGYYYDYIGIDKKQRHEFYDKLRIVTEKYGMDYLDLRDKEYEPYFYCDVMHLGWRGWLYVNQKVAEYFG